MSYYTNHQYLVEDGEREFDVLCPYLERSHIKVRVNGILEQFQWVSGSRIRLVNEAPDRSIVTIRRITPIETQLVVFNDGATLTQEDMNRSIKQVLFRQQEQDDIVTGALEQAKIRVGDNLGIVTDPATIAEELLLISELGEDVVNRFRAALSDVDRNGETLIDHTVKLANTAFRMDTLQGVVDALANLEDGTGLATIIQNEAQERLDGDTALASTIGLIGAKSGDGLSFILDMNKVKASPTETLAQRFDAIYAANDDTLALIQNESNARVAADSATASTLSTLGTNVANNTAAIAAETIARSNAISAEASSRSALAATVGNNHSFAQNAINTLSNDVGSLASTLALLGAKNGAGTAFIMDLNKVQLGGGVSMASRLSGIDTSLGNNTAAIVAEQSARASADSAMASQISTLQTNFNGQSASITNLQSIVSGTNGLVAKVGLSVNVNGHITGWTANNNGRTGTMAIMANVFSIIDPNNGNAFVPFEVSGGVTRIKNALIENLEVTKLGSGFYNGEMRLGTGRIVQDNGTVMKVQGMGFGTSNQFIEWFGPSMAIHLCNEINAISYTKTNGDCYFGGSLSAGTLTTKAATSDQSTSAVAETSTFGSNGGQITVVVSYSAASSYSRQVYEAPWPPNFNTGVQSVTAQVKLYRSVNNGAYSEVATMNASGTSQAEGYLDGDYYREMGNIGISSSLTYSDPQTNTQNRRYKAQLISRSFNFYSGYQTSQSQNLTVICTEQ